MDSRSSRWSADSSLLYYFALPRDEFIPDKVMAVPIGPEGGGSPNRDEDLARPNVLVDRSATVKPILVVKADRVGDEGARR